MPSHLVTAGIPFLHVISGTLVKTLILMSNGEVNLPRTAPISQVQSGLRKQVLGMPPLASPRSAYTPLLPLGLQLGSPPHALYFMTLCPCPDYHHRRHHRDSTPLLLRVSNPGDGRESSIWSGSPSLALRLWPWEHSQKNRTSL